MGTMTALLAASILSAASGPAPAPGSAQPGQPVKQERAKSDSILKVYDARDLNVLLGENRSGQPPAEQVMMRLASALQVSMTPLADGIFAITGSEDQHDVLARLIEDLRSVQGTAYELDLTLYPVASESAPALGSKAAVTPEALRARQAVRTGSSTRIAAARRTTIISDWSPVVSDSTLGFDPQTSELEDGLIVEASLGSSRQGEGIMLHLTGAMTRLNVQETPIFVLDRERPLSIGLPKTETRSLAADLRLKVGELTVIAVAPGFESGQSLVLAAAVREVPLQ